MSYEIILQKLSNIERMLAEQNLLRKEVLNLKEACQYLNMSESHLYKLTSKREIPHSCPNGKRLYFTRSELNTWLQRNRQITMDQIEVQASDYVIRNRLK